LAARGAGGADRILALSREYIGDHSADPLAHYYRANAALVRDAPLESISTLVEGIEQSVRPPALLWYLLGWSYIEIQAWPQAVVSLETARALVEAGDSTLGLHSDQPVAMLFVALGKAYLGAGRCVDAESMLSHAISIGALGPEPLSALQEAQVCQMATPTASP
jgi:uncharacterized protein HemY